MCTGQAAVNACGVVLWCGVLVWLQALRCALELEPRLMGPIRTAASSSCRFKCTARLFGKCTVFPVNTSASLPAGVAA
jgi:hypothetical protein